MWRGAATNKSIKGYGESVVAGHKKTGSTMNSNRGSRPPSGIPPKSSASNKRPPVPKPDSKGTAPRYSRDKNENSVDNLNHESTTPIEI